MKAIQKCYLQHDWLYSSSLIPKKALDGKDAPKIVYVITKEYIIDCSADGLYHYDTLEEAKEMLPEFN